MLKAAEARRLMEESVDVGKAEEMWAKYESWIAKAAMKGESHMPFYDINDTKRSEAFVRAMRRLAERDGYEVRRNDAGVFWHIYW